MTVKERLEEKRKEVLRLAAKHGAGNVRVFGSVARAEDKTDSDIDLLVDTNTETSAWFPVGLILELEELLGCKVDVVTERALHWYIRDKVLQEAVPL